jgi:glucose dehydrogenase
MPASWLQITDINPYAENKEELLQLLRQSRSEGPFTPLSKKGTIIYPGLDGGAEWGGAAADPDGILYLNSSEMAWRISLGPLSVQSAKCEHELRAKPVCNKLCPMPWHGAPGQ